MNSIEVYEKKTLKLNNVISKEIGFESDPEIQSAERLLMAYIGDKELKPYGPLIIKMSIVYENGEISERKWMMVQVKQAPEAVEPPYGFTALLKAENCLMARYCGETRSLPMALTKLKVHAFETDITLSGDAYTIVTVRNKDGTIKADVFAEAVE